MQTDGFQVQFKGFSDMPSAAEEGTIVMRTSTTETGVHTMIVMKYSIKDSLTCPALQKKLI